MIIIYYIIFFLFLIYSLIYVITTCQNFFPLHFDNQILLFWQYAADRGLIPYRDLYYQYGLLAYYKGHNIVYTFIYILLTPILFTSIFYIFQKVFKSKLFSLFSLFALFIFMARITGFEIFTRYGILAAMSLIIPYIFYNDKYVRLKSFSLGILGGVIFPLVNDQGIYVSVLFAAFVLVDIFVKKGFINILELTRLLIQRWGLYLAGFTIAILPYVIYLYLNNSLIQFTNSFIELSELQMIAKTPFFHGIFTFHNLFTFLILITSVIYISSKLFYKEKLTVTHYIQLGLVIAIIILEQKSIWRHIDEQISFVSFILFIVLFADLRETFRKRKVIDKNILLFFVNIAAFILVLFFMTLNQTTQTMSCSEKTSLHKTKYAKVTDYLATRSGFNSKVYSYPGDTVFYVLASGANPYYPTTFEGSSKKAQDQTITYIDSNVNYVIYNYTNFSIQDGVPNYIRSSYINKYLLTNYKIETIIGEFLILKRDSNVDIFKDDNFSFAQGFKEYLTSINLEEIPKSEGMHKFKKINSYEEVSLNSLKSKGVSSDNLFIVIKSKNINKKSMVKIKTKDQLETDITFSSCGAGDSCIINISKIPLFYNTRIINEIISNDNSEITLLNINDSKLFW